MVRTQSEMGPHALLLRHVFTRTYDFNPQQMIKCMHLKRKLPIQAQPFLIV